jgi:3-oxoacyl-[acyl-carrier-protein] synthase-3
MSPSPGGVTIGSFACELGDVECRPEDVPGFEEAWSAVSPGADFATMGCGAFRKMTGQLEDYVIECVRRTLSDRQTAAEDVDYVVFSTTDACLGLLGRDFAVRVLTALGMVRCVPVVLSLQQCCSTMTALRYGWDLFTDRDVDNVVLVSFERTPDDRDRLRSFAFFGDAVVSSLVSRHPGGALALASSAVHVDHDGLVGRDSFASRQQVAQRAFDTVLTGGDTLLDKVTAVFPTNLYQPIALFGAAATGVARDRLHFAAALRAYAHCGNCDWMLNLMDYERSVGISPGETYMVQASAPGFFACGLLVAV